MSGSVTEGNATETQTGSAAALNADAIASFDINDFQSGYVQILGTWVGTLTFQGSNDGTNFVSVLALNNANPTAPPSTTTTANGIFYFPTPFRYFRLRMTAYTSGTATATAFFQRIPNGDLGKRNVAVTGATNSAEVTSLNDLQVVDVPNQTGLNATLALTTSAIEGKVGASTMTNRKYVEMQALSNNVKWGYDTSCPFDLFKNQFFALPAGTNCKVYFKMSTGTGSVAFAEK